MTLTAEITPTLTRSLCIPCDGVMLAGDLALPKCAHGIVMFIPGSGSSRHSPRNREMARQLQEAHVGTLLFDVLTHQEEARDLETGQFRFDIDFLTRRILAVRSWLARDSRIRHLPVGYFGASTGSAAALAAAASRHNVRAPLSPAAADRTWPATISAWSRRRRSSSSATPINGASPQQKSLFAAVLREVLADHSGIDPHI